MKVPKLLRTYLAIGARIAAPPAWDREFRTIDFLTLLDLKLLSLRGAQPLSGPADAMTLRRIRRAVALAFMLALCILRYWLARLRGPMTLERRALWLQACARSILSSLGITYEVEGQPPTCGLVVSNHLSYLDIIIISAAMPCFFVAKVEIDGWPFFGKAARTRRDDFS